MKSWFIATPIFVTLWVCSIHAHAATLQEIDSQITIDLPIETIQLAIAKAGAMRRWEVIEKAPGHLEGVVRVRSHVAVVDIHFDKKRYSIRHSRSENMNYKDGKIDRRFNDWIRTLDRDIQAMLTYM